MPRKKNQVCHVCNNTKKDMATCSAFRCTISYCFDCIKQIYDKEFQSTKYIENCWVCYSCGKTCKCDICQGVIPTKRKRTNKYLQSGKNHKTQQKISEKIKEQELKNKEKIQDNKSEIKVKLEKDSQQLSIRPQLDHASDKNQGQNNQICNFSTNSIFIPPFQAINTQPAVGESFQQMQYIFFYF